MDNAKKIEVIEFIIQTLDEKHKAGRRLLYTCHICEVKYPKKSEEYIWYGKTIQTFPENFPKEFDLIRAKLPARSIKREENYLFEVSFFSARIPFEDGDFKNRIFFLNTILKSLKS